MKKWVIAALVLIVAVLVILFFVFSDEITGNVTGPPANAGQEHTVGPSQAEQNCMMTCMKCTSPGVGCTGNQENCTLQCNVKKPETTTETACMEKCVLVGCTEFDFTCQGENQEKCEKECDMIKAPDESTMSAEQICISQCVNAESPGTICGASQEGETGNELCQRCAASCVQLYAGPCLDDKKLQEAKKACETCEHCYGKPVMGDSGEGWECIVSVECGDASSEFGDNPGTGPGIIQSVGNTVGDIVESVGNFFKNLFS